MDAKLKLELRRLRREVSRLRRTMNNHANFLRNTHAVMDSHDAELCNTLQTLISHIENERENN